MTRIEIIALFSALDKLCDNGDIKSIKEVVQEVLKEAGKDDKAFKQEI
jgi:hypothetical protein